MNVPLLILILLTVTYIAVALIAPKSEAPPKKLDAKTIGQVTLFRDFTFKYQRVWTTFDSGFEITVVEGTLGFEVLVSILGWKSLTLALRSSDLKQEILEAAAKSVEKVCSDDSLKSQESYKATIALAKLIDRVEDFDAN